MLFAIPNKWMNFKFYYYSLTVRKFLQAWKSRHISNSGMKFCPSLNQCPMTFVMLPLKVNPTFVCLTDKWCKFSSKVCLHETFSFASRLKMLSQTWKKNENLYNFTKVKSWRDMAKIVYKLKDINSLSQCALITY